MKSVSIISDFDESKKIDLLIKDLHRQRSLENTKSHSYKLLFVVLLLLSGYIFIF